jgi:tripartite-type tricarboxylate transporter receptor subunit TctC
MTGVTFNHVPHKGAGPALIDLLGGHVQFAFSSLPAALPHTRSGKLKALAVSGLKRSTTVPNIPTVAESDPSRLAGFETNQWYVLLGPARLPPAIVQRLNRETNKTLLAPDVRAKLDAQGYEIEGTTPEAARDYIRRELEKWARVAAAAGIKADVAR